MVYYCTSQKGRGILQTLDCLGDTCPVPLMRLQQQLKQAEDEIMLVTDHSCVTRSIEDYCQKRGLSIRSDEVMNGVWELHIKQFKEKA